MIIRLLFCILFVSTSVSAEILEDIEQYLETKRMVALEKVKQTAHLIPFESDGCSGGMSAGWEYLADKFPSFSDHFGQQPPWYTCCVEHDRAYWIGETDHGYHKRKTADLRLKACVEELGAKLAPELSLSQTLDKKDIKLSFRISGQLMYRAVRLGGQPCSPFPWRWGYGWPNCTFR